MELLKMKFKSSSHLIPYQIIRFDLEHSVLISLPLSSRMRFTTDQPNTMKRHSRSCLSNLSHAQVTSDERSSLSVRMATNIDFRLWGHGYESRRGRNGLGGWYMGYWWWDITVKLQCKSFRLLSHHVVDFYAKIIIYSSIFFIQIWKKTPIGGN